MRRWMILIAVLAFLTAAEAARSDDSPFRVELGLGGGRSSNPLLLPEAGQSGFFLPYTFDLAWERDFESGVAFRLRLDGDGRRYEDPLLRNGGLSRTEIEARWRWDISRPGRARTWLYLKTEAAYDRQFLVRRATGEDFVREVENRAVNLRRRYVSRKYDLELTLVRKTRKGRLRLEMEARRADYVHDFRDVPTVDSLDHNRLLLKAGYRREISRRFDLSGEAEVGWKWYDEKFPLSSILQDVVGGPAQTYRYENLDVGATWRPLPGARWRDRLEITLEHDLGRREDLYQGMLTRTEREWKMEAGLSLPRGVEIDLQFSRDRTVYDRYPIYGSPNRPLFRQDERTAEVELAVPVGDRFRIEFDGLRQQSGGSHPLYQYTETRGQTMFVWRF